MVNWRYVYALGAALNTATWGLYFSFTRRYLSVELGGGTQTLLLISGLEWAFTLFAILSSKLVEKVGSKYVALLGITGVIPFIVALRIYDPNILAVILSLASLSWALSWPSILQAVFSGDDLTPGRAYGYFTVGSGIGYSLGSMAMGILYGLTGAEGVFITIVLMYAVTYLIFFKLYPAEKPHRIYSRNYGGNRGVIYGTLPALIALSLTVFTREILYSIAPLKLSSEILKVLPASSELTEYTLFGVVFGGITALLSVPARITAGKLSDKYNPLIILSATSSAYLITYWSFVRTEGLVPIIVWQIPLYPFLDVSINAYIAKHVPRHAMTLGFGTALMFSAVGGLMLLPVLMMQNTSPEFLGCLVTASTTLAVLIIALKLRHIKRSERLINS